MLKPSSWTKGITIEAKVLQKIIVKTITPITLLFIKPKNKNEPPMLHNIIVNNKIVVNLLICKYESPFLCFPKTVKSVSNPLKNKRIPIPMA